MPDHATPVPAAAFECAHANLLAKNDLISVAVRWPDNSNFNNIPHSKRTGSA